MTVNDRVRQGLFSIIFLTFVGYTIKHVDFNPYPKWLSERHQTKWQGAGLDQSILKDGDLILRHSKGFVSDAILSFSTDDPQYSHSGIIKMVNGKAHVYHATGGEENASNKMKLDPISLYCHPAAVFKFGIFRYDLAPEEMADFMRIMDRYYAAGVEFDTDFDMETDNKMYCSEMIYKALLLATNDKNFIPLSQVINKPYVAIDNLYLNNHCNLIFKYDYD
ncbi:MAG: YiiX/YebB-like N1pC/P60 family cysteine hydrolase [Bacteroidota bacterium]